MTKQHIYAKVDDVEILKYYDRVGIKPTADVAFTFTINPSNDNTVSISAKANPVGEVVIPYKTIIDGIEYTVTKIGSDAFANNPELTSVIIPSTVKSIHATAFNGCTNLTTISRAETIGMATTNNGEIFNDYINNEASSGSHAEGRRTKAIGQYSHAEGSSTTASGEASHVEGDHTEAIGRYSHAEGTFTKAISKYSSVKGSRAIAGCKGYWYSSVELNDDGTTTIKLTTTHDNNMTEEWSESDKCGYQPNDVISIIADSKFYNCATIKSVNNNVIVVDKDLSKELTDSKFTFDDGFDGNIIYVISKPDVGYVDLGIGAMAEGGRYDTDQKLSGAFGPYSHAEGRHNQAIGHYSHAEGRNNIASNVCAHVEGQNNVASGLLSHAEGSYTEAIGDYSHAEGNNTTAEGTHSHTEGSNTTAVGKSAHAEGNSTEASGYASHAEGDDTVASNLQSHAEGYKTVSKGGASHSEGAGTIASGYAQHVQGRYNIEDTAKKYAHIVGNGEKEDVVDEQGKVITKNRSNAHTLDWYGNAWFAGAVTSTGADIAELYEWSDGNPNNEDRRGLFVTLDGKYIKPANPEDDYILGAVSAMPAIVGDSYGSAWHGMYLKDIFGSYLKQLVYHEAVYEDREHVDSQTGEISIEKVLVRPEYDSLELVVNPDYDSSQEYIPRHERPEYDYVSSWGKLVLVDDGTCEVNGFVTVGKDGKATKSDEVTSIRVMERKDETHVFVVMK